MRPEPNLPRVEPVPVDADAQGVAVLAEAFADYPALRYPIGPVGAAFPERLAALLTFSVAGYLEPRPLSTGASGRGAREAPPCDRHATEEPGDQPGDQGERQEAEQHLHQDGADAEGQVDHHDQHDESYDVRHHQHLLSVHPPYCSRTEVGRPGRGPRPPCVRWADAGRRCRAIGIEGAAWGRRLRTLSWSRRVATAPDRTWACFLADLWLAGAGFGPRPVVEEAGDAHGAGCTRRIGIGARGVRERITATEHPQRLEYRVVNPSWTTFPVDHHLGTVTFVADEGGGTDMHWQVDLVPKLGAGLLVVAATRFVIGRYLDALTRACRSELNRTRIRHNRRP